MKKALLFLFISACLPLWATDFQSVNVENFIRETWNPQTVILDVRTLQEYTDGHLAGAVWADLKQADFLTLVKQQIPQDKRIAVYCRSGKRSKTAAEQLTAEGYVVTELDGGIVEWQKAGKRVVKGAPADIEPYMPHIYQANKQFSVAYRDIAIGSEPAKRLIVYLHSSSASGIDNELPVRQRTFRQLTDYLHQNQIDAYLLIPQCRIDRRWNEYRPMQGCVMSEALYGLIKQYAKEHEISDIYIVGESFGGAGVWRMLSDYPKLFSGGMLVASYPLKNVKPANIAKTALCAVLGEKDDRASIEKTEPTIHEIQQKKGSRVRYLVLPNADHYTTCNTAFNKENLDWLLQQTKATVSK